MRKYKVIVEAELVLPDYKDKLNLFPFNNTVKFVSYETEYKFCLKLDTGHVLFPANINKINVSEITE